MTRSTSSPSSIRRRGCHCSRLIDQLPTMHGALGATVSGATHQIDASAFEFISENAQIQQVREFMRLLPKILGG